jgi:hypothetical protein
MEIVFVNQDDINAAANASAQTQTAMVPAKKPCSCRGSETVAQKITGILLFSLLLLLVLNQIKILRA